MAGFIQVDHNEYINIEQVCQFWYDSTELRIYFKLPYHLKDNEWLELTVSTKEELQKEVAHILEMKGGEYKNIKI